MEGKGEEERTCEIKPNMPMRSNIASNKGCVGITGEILNIIMLAWMSRNYFETKGVQIDTYPAVEPNTQLKE
jgi:hypothetical protein